jgi:hypothetical protein
MESFSGVILLIILEFLNYKKKVIRIISGVVPRESYRNLFKKLDILPLSCEYIPFLVAVCNRQSK